ncbi:MAG: type II secretion system protein GspJ [Thermodesulfobacteriota bacterium]
MILTERRKREGFTLIEVMVALFILSMIFSILYSAFFPTQKVINSFEERGGYWRIMEGTIQVLSHDIRAASIPSANEVSVFEGSSEGPKQPVIALSSYTPYQEGGIGRLKRIEYNIEDLPEDGSLFLRRLVYRGTQEVVEDEVLIDGLSGIEFSYFDGEEWKDRWDAGDSKALPKGVRIIITSEERGEIISVIPIETS